MIKIKNVETRTIKQLPCAKHSLSVSFKEEVAEGWTTTSLQLSVMFFFLFAILAILSEYIGKILQESRKEQPYHVVNELNSKISVADATRRNIEK